MNATSTPRNQKALRRRSLVSTPLRSSNVGVSTPMAAPFEPVDEEQERSNRRSMVAMQRRLTNISAASSPYVDNCPVIEESQIKDMLRNYAELNAQNRISQKNAWQVHVIDIMRRMVMTDNTNVLQVAGSSLDIGAKVYGLRVDDIHAKGLQLASSMAKRTENKQQADDGGEGMDQDNSLNQDHQRRRNARKRTKKMAGDKRNTIDKDEKALYGSIKHAESVIFATNENIEASATDNLFTSKLPTNPSNHQLMLLNTDKHWCNAPDKVLDIADKLLEIELPNVAHYNACSSFKDFETGNWDPEEEERLLAEAPCLPEAVLDENGIPLAELDGSVHDIFENNNDIPEDIPSDVDEQQEVFEAQIHGEVAHIVDAIPEENRIQTEYGYNTLVRASSGKFIDKIWAGPCHWKVKFNRRSSARYSGATVEVVKHTKKTKVPQKIDFSKLGPDLCETIPKFVPKRAPAKTTFEKCTLPIPDLSFLNVQKLTEELLMKPGVRRPRLNNPIQEQPDCEVQVYNYENPNDSLYCSQNNGDDPNNDDPMNNSFEEELLPATQQQFLNDNLVNAPELVSATYIPYAMQAKKMDMKKLKTAVWKTITQSSGENEKNGRIVHPTRFSTLYQELPQLITTEMRKELTSPLALVALLHLCNENNLELRQGEDRNDFTIFQCKE